MKSYFKQLMYVLPLVTISACTNSNKETKNDNNRLEVQVMNVSYVNNTNELRVSGNVEGSKTVKLGFMVAGRIMKIAAKEGDVLQKGNLLAQLDPESYTYAKDLVDANLNQTQDEYNRLKRMYDLKSISESDYNKITNALKAAKAEQSIQKKNLNETRLVVPFRSVLLTKNAEEGEIINVGLPLFVLSDIFTVSIRTSIPESNLRNIQIGRKVSVNIPALDNTFVGTITEKGSLADGTTRSFPIKIEVKNPNLHIRPGMTAEVNITTNVNEHIIVLPSASVLQDEDNSSYVYVVDPLKMQVFKRIVSLGKIIGNSLEITSGIRPNDKVVTQGQNKLTNEMWVIIKK